MGYRKSFVLILVFATLITIIVNRPIFLNTPVPNVSAVTVAPHLGVYWDKNCHKSVSSIDWGAFSPGELKKIAVYVRNEGNDTVLLTLTPLNWNPENASHYLNFTWSCEDRKLEVGQVVIVAQTLTASPLTTGTCDFSFGIVFDARTYYREDVNTDGSVNILDLELLSHAMWSTPIDSNWIQNADLNGDNCIDALDYFLLARNYGKS